MYIGNGEKDQDSSFVVFGWRSFSSQVSDLRRLMENVIYLFAVLRVFVDNSAYGGNYQEPASVQVQQGVPGTAYNENYQQQYDSEGIQFLYAK
ncbi:hypothetical protein K1719_035863 [Acacia pycnantha]|nr:hypothetical protein K1719_035863 [Acacia pycnantha]